MRGTWTSGAPLSDTRLVVQCSLGLRNMRMTDACAAIAEDFAAAAHQWLGSVLGSPVPLDGDDAAGPK
jgi:hypothetical protein